MKYTSKIFAVVSLLLAGLSGCHPDNGSSLGAAEKQEAANKELVLTFYQRLFGDKDISAIDDYIGQNYIQHNPQIPDGRDALKAVLSQWFKGAPKTQVDVPNAGADGDLVFLHVKNKDASGRIVGVVVDIFRLEDNKIIEHWDAIQDMPATSANSHPLF